MTLDFENCFFYRGLQDFFIRKSIYLLLHKLKLCVYRNLFKRAHVRRRPSTRSSLGPLVLTQRYHATNTSIASMVLTQCSSSTSRSPSWRVLGSAMVLRLYEY